uniref:Uncharacterized protein n=1 Tax=Phlebotomus papatasi TaxID=29031 RepID=A0A1B0GQH5_PHLPP
MDYEEIQIKEEPDFFESDIIKTEYDITELEDPLAIKENEKYYVEGQIPTYIKPSGIKCSYCEREFFNTNTFERHMYQDHRGLPPDAHIKEKYQCGICNQIVRTKKDIRYHLEISHKQIGIPIAFPYVLKMITCPITGKTAPEKLTASAT